ncbi:MAG: hypothetical protein M5U14_04770 [Acidimicrobiia bacterium]|nr:hypothetical protein [Acidimicrobiia bacterium]
MEAVLHQGERLLVPERLIVAPAAGVFHPSVPSSVSPEGVPLAEGQVVGRLDGPGSSTPVRSPFGGFLMGMLAQPGERLRPGQPVAWLRVA